MSTEKPVAAQRLLSLDALRGFNMFFITGGDSFLWALSWLVSGRTDAWLATQMKHVPWQGLHFYDTIFPLFLFITGVTFPFSTAKRRERGDSDGAIARNVIRRTLVLVACGLVFSQIQNCDWEHFRVWSVIGRIGLVWGIAALLTLFLRLRTCIIVSAAILVGWWLLLRFVPAPGAPAGINPLLDPQYCIDRWVDANFLTTAHRGEGGLATIAMIPTAFFGIWAGMYLKRTGEDHAGSRKTLRMLCAAAALALAGWLWSLPTWGCPIIKNCWSGSFALVTGGISLALLAAFHWLIDVRGWAGWSFYFRVIGVNAIAIYMGQKFIPFKDIGKFFLGALPQLFENPAWASWIGTCGRLAAAWALLYFLYRKRIFIKA